MKTIIAGSRDLGHLQWNVVDKAVAMAGWKVTEVVCGMAPGADTFGRLWADAVGIPVREMPAAWRVDGVYNPRAGFERNQTMADYAEALIAIWDMKSGGTKDMIKRAKKAGLRTFVFDVKKPDTTIRLFDWED